MSITGAAETYALQSQARYAETRADALRAALDGVISAWESLPEGNYTPNQIQRWLSDKMRPAIKAARATR